MLLVWQASDRVTADCLEPIPDRLVVLTFDDSVKSQFTVARPILNKYGFGATFYITEGFTFHTNKQDYMTWKEIRQLHQDGFEIGNHTRDHIAVTAKTLDQLGTQLSAIDAECERNGIPKTTTFAWPGNAIIRDGLPRLDDYGFQFARRGGMPEFARDTGLGPAYQPGRDHPLLIPSAAIPRPGFTLEKFVSAVSKAKNGRIAVLQFHGVPEGEHPWVNTPRMLFEESMKYLHDHDYTVIALRDLRRFVDPSDVPNDPWTVINERKNRAAAGGVHVVTKKLAAGEVRIENQHLIVQVEGQQVSLLSKSAELTIVSQVTFPHPIVEVITVATRHPAWGDGRAIRLLHDNGWRTSLALYEKNSFLHIDTVVTNQLKEPYEIDSLKPVQLNLNLGGDPSRLRVLGTGGLTTVAKSQGSYAFSVVADPNNRRGVVCGWLTHERGVGAFFPKLQDNVVQLTAQLDFGHYQVDPGKSRPTETLLVGYFDDARFGLEAYANSIAGHYQIKLPPKPGVYCTWYHAGASDEKKVAANAQFAGQHLKPFGLSVVQIDDHWQRQLPNDFKTQGPFKRIGPVKVFVDTNKNYSQGMAVTAANIQRAGFTPGIWFMPFAGNHFNPYFDQRLFAQNADGSPFVDTRWSGTCLDLTNPQTQQFVAQRVKRIRGWGYRYFKMDGMHTGVPSRNIYVNTAYRAQPLSDAKLQDPHMTHIEAYRKGLDIVRSTAPDVFLLGCTISQNMLSMGPAFGKVDAMRVGPDNGAGSWSGTTRGAWHGTNLYFLNGRVWHNDPDPIYVRPKQPLEYARWMCSWLAVSDAMHSSSYQYAELPAERLDILKRCLPITSFQTRPVDLLETNQPRIWLAQDQRMHVIGLFNWSEKKPDEIRYPLGKMGLDPKSTYVAFDYWADRFLPPFHASLKQTLEPGTCRILAVRRQTDHPQLLSTSRHITQGLMDVVAERWDSESRTLFGKSQVVAGDQYELRIALPANGEWVAKKATAKAQKLELETETAGVRARFVPEKSGLVEWEVSF
jgi:peptidoglycan/xylan/chitin deacetylase (PgdA/CDA1 family)